MPPDSLDCTAAYAAAFEHAAIGMALVGVDGQLLGGIGRCAKSSATSGTSC